MPDFTFENHETKTRKVITQEEESALISFMQIITKLREDHKGTLDDILNDIDMSNESFNESLEAVYQNFIGGPPDNPDATMNPDLLLEVDEEEDEEEDEE